MLHAWITLLVLCHEATGFLIHNTQHSLCLEDQAGPGPGAVGLGRCNLDSRFQQWVWLNRRVLRNLGSDRCLASRGIDLVRTVGCPAAMEEQEEEEVVVQGAGAGAGEGGAGVVEEEMLWDCLRSRLISVISGLELSVDDSLSLALSPLYQRSGRWRSLDEGDICQEILRSKRASREPGEFEEPSESMDPRDAMAGMTEEQKKFLSWYYRTEDPTIWKFVMLGLSFVSLLVGFLLLGMGSMANKNRREIAKYKAAAALARQPGGEELQTLNDFQGHNDLEAPPQGHSPAPPALDGAGLSQGEIVLTWRDGNVSTLYPDPLPEEEVEVGVEEEKEEGKGEGCIEQTPHMEESSRDESLVKECGACNDDGVQQIMNGKIE
ncbi:solute carrier family 51 subunit beta isoform X2 [Gadus chalcogrammus]|nr:solute carrier family 51 subunit beta isoform X2 [Gadus chalcogrammus]